MQANDPAVPLAAGAAAAAPVEARMSRLTDLVDCLAEGPRAEQFKPPAHLEYESRLVQARLGMAAALFVALRCKHAPTASHSLRVAVGCSSWALALGWNDEQLEIVETAGLLHDIGKIGVPDCVLLKPGALAPDEAALMDRQRQMGLDILRSCCSDGEVLDVVRHVPAWFDGSRPQGLCRGEEIPLAARLIAVVDAYDSMTTDHIYRRALSRDRATAELFRFAGTQFDRELVTLFCQRRDSAELQRKVAGRWLTALDPESANTNWGFQATPVAVAGASELDELFEQKLLESMHDAVVFVDRSLRVTRWNRGAERMTGVAGESIFQRLWLPSVVGLCDEHGEPTRDDDCPVAYAVESGVQSLRRMQLAGRQGKNVAVDVHVVPVASLDGATHGAVVILHDSTSEASLEQRCQSLHERATKDPLTQVANRAEFDRTHQQFVETHLEHQLPCSLIICDIDHFKQVNDVYGHQAGDEVLKVFAQVLKTSCRAGDLVARYGGEEFVMLCADCNNATAAHRAEQLRRAISDLPQPALAGKRITASFGVTELQHGDTTETMLRRADRGLYQAKQMGRNTVVQLGSGMSDSPEAPKRRAWFGRGAESAAGVLLERWLSTTVPLNMTVEKLRGFVADHHADITKVDEHHLEMILDGEQATLSRRGTDRPVSMIVELDLTEKKANPQAAVASERTVRTQIHVVLRPRRDRDRRRENVAEKARQVISSLKSYLMAVEEEAPPPAEPELGKGKTFGQWFRRRSE